MAHTRLGSARWPAAHPPTANQLTCQDDPRPDRPLKQGPRFALCHASIGGCTQGRPAAFPPRTPALDALIGNRRAGSPGLRPLAPLPSALVPNQRNPGDLLGRARPFLPSSPSPKPRLRAKRIGGVISLDLSPESSETSSGTPWHTPTRLTGVLTFPVIFLRQMTVRIALFLRKRAERKKRRFSAALRVSGTLRKGHRLRLIFRDPSRFRNSMN